MTAFGESGGTCGTYLRTAYSDGCSAEDRITLSQTGTKQDIFTEGPQWAMTVPEKEATCESTPGTRRWLEVALRYLPQSQFGRRVSILGAGALANQALQALTVPIIGRLYGPVNIGDWALLQSMAAVVATVSGLRYELAVVVADTEEEATSAALVQILSNVFIAGVLLCIVSFFARYLARVVGAQELAAWLFTVPVVAFLTSMFGLAINWLIRAAQYQMLARITLVQSGVTVAVQVLAALLFRPGLDCLVLGVIIGQVASIGAIRNLVCVKRGAAVARHLSGEALWRAARKHSEFPKYTAPWSLVGALRERGLVILLGMFGTVRVIGFYAMALRLVWAPQGLASTSLSAVLFQRAAEEADVANVGPLVLTVNLKIILLATPIFLFLAWWSGDLIALLLGEQWRGAGIYVSVLCTPALGFVLQGWLVRLLSVSGHQHVGFITEAAYSVAALASFGTALAIRRNAPFAVGAFTVITVLYQVAFLIVCYRCCRFPSRDLVRLGYSFLSLAAGIAAVFGTVALLPATHIKMYIDALALLIYYAVLSYRSRPSST